MNKGTNRTRECSVKKVPSLNQVIQKIDSPDIKQGSLDTTTAIGAFAGANYDSFSQLNKDLLNKEQELQKINQDLLETEAHHEEEI